MNRIPGSRNLPAIAMAVALAAFESDEFSLRAFCLKCGIDPLTLRDVREIYDLRLLLEPAAAAEAAGRIEPTELVRLEQLGATTLDVDDSDSVERFMAANRAVHVAVAEAAGNRRAAAIVARLLDDSERARLVALRAGAGGRGLRARDEHLQLLAALGAGNGEDAERLMRLAIQRFRD